MLEICLLVFLAVFVTILSIILVVHSSVCCINKSPIRFNKGYGQRGVLLVTAHPDDECMFFAPTILMLQQLIDAEIHLLCLSSGNFYGEGKVREKELLSSCKVLGIDKHTVINDDNLPDDPNIHWKPDTISRYVSEIVEKENIQIVVTFDGKGVSNHPNHIAIYRAMKQMVQSQKINPDTQVFCLETTNLLRKYNGIFDLPITMLTSPISFILSFSHVMQAQKAMRCHWSQYVWFRRLYVVFSRYMIMNTLKPIT